MNTFQAIVLAIIEGVTEFLPISSTGHMAIASAFFKIKLVWLSDLRFVPYDKRSLVVPVAISISAPQYLLDVQSLPSLPFGIPISSDVQFQYQWQKVTRFNSSHHTPFFSFENNTHQPKGTSSKEVKIRALESKIICSFLQFFPPADLDSRQLLFARLRKIGIPLPSAATWRMHLKIWLNGCPFRSNFDREALTSLSVLWDHHMFCTCALR